MSPAEEFPVDASSFPAADFRVDPDIRKAETLPARAFTDPAFLELELAALFARSWLLLPQRPGAEFLNDPRSLADLVRRRGSRAPVTLLDRPFFLQRDWQGKLHAFPNVCTHAWHVLVEGPGSDRSITCPQHGRQFDCAGKFLRQPGFECDGDFPRASDHLRDAPVGEWGDFLFLCPGEPAAPLDELLGPARESVKGLSPEEFERRPLPYESHTLAGNWKQHAWNYLDKFHIGFIHRAPGGLADAIDLGSYRTEVGTESVLQWAWARDPAHGFDPGLLPRRFRDADPKRRVFALWWFLFPNLALNFYPWGLSVNVYMPSPGRPDRTQFFWTHHVGNPAKYEARNTTWLNEQVDAEDVDAMTQVGRGAASGMAVRGRFAPGEEAGPHWFHRKVWEMTMGEKGGAHRQSAPGAGRKRRH